MKQIFGDFQTPDDGQEYLVIHFSPTSVPLQQRWRNNGLSADFLAEYWATFFPKENTPSLNGTAFLNGSFSENRQLEIKGMVNYIANELLENMMKFNYNEAAHPVSLGLYLFDNAFRFYSSNAVDPDGFFAFQERIQRLLEEDANDLYLEQIEMNVLNGGDGSHLGLLTMISDYEAKLAWKFEALSSDLTVVTTMVQVAL